MKHSWKRLMLSSAAAIVCVPCIAMAQNAKPEADSSTPAAEAGLEEIVVTAQRRSQSIQFTPLAISAFSGDDLAQRGKTVLADMGRDVPGLNVSQQGGSARITIRGIGFDSFSIGAEGAATFNVDGVVYSRQASALAGFYDVDRIEVLRGPQGTLYGRNATSGAINVITRRPSGTLEGFAALTLGNYSTVNAEGGLGGPISDTISGRLSFNTQERDGYGRNLVTGHDIDDRQSRAVRGQLLFEPSADLSILLSGDYYRQHDNSGGLHVLGPGGEILVNPLDPTGPTIPMPIVGLGLPGGGIPANRRDIAGLDPETKNTFYGGLLDITYELNDAVSLRSLSAARFSRELFVNEVAPVGPTQLIATYRFQDSDQYTQEFQLNISTARHNFVAGLFYLDESIDGRQPSPFNAVLFGGPDTLLQGTQFGGELTTDAAAVFAQDTYSVFDNFRVTVGGRYSWEKKKISDYNRLNLAEPFDINRPIDLSAPDTLQRVDDETWSSFTPKLGVEVDLAPQVMAYASYSKGFRSGSYNFAQPTQPAVSPEKVAAYEAGIKSTLFEGRLRANASGYYYDYTNLQVFKTFGVSLIQENAATARIYGAEGEFLFRPLDAHPLELDLNFSLLHARYRRYFSADGARLGQADAIDPDTGLLAFDLSGNRMPQAPSYMVNLGVQDTVAVGLVNLTARFESAWTGQVYFSQFNQPTSTQKATEVFNAYLSIEPENSKYYVNAYIKNIADKDIVASGNVSVVTIGSPSLGYFQPPRTYGVTVGSRF